MTDNWLTARREKLLLAAVFLIIASSTTIWTLGDKTPPPWDPSDHIRYGYDYYHLVSQLDFRGFAREFFVAPHFYAPLVHLSTAAIFLLFGASRFTAILINFFALALLLASVSWIARRIAGANRPAGEQVSPASASSVLLIGILAAMIAACSHFSAWLIHDAFLDFPLMAAVASCMALLIRAGDFSSRRFALQFAVAAGLGLLVKQTFAFFFILPALFVTVRVLLTKRRSQVLNLILTCLIIAAIASIWYVPHFGDVVSIYRENQRAAFDENEAPLFSFDSSFFPIHALLSFQLQVPFAILFLVGLIYSFARRQRESTILCLWLASGLTAFALVANKDVRYTVPVVPAAAVLCVSWLSWLFSSSNPKLRRIGIGMSIAIASWCLVSFFNAQWPASGMGVYINTPRYQWMVFARNYFGFDHRPLSDDWSVPEIVRTVASLGLNGDESARINSDQSAGEQNRATSPKQGASPAKTDETGGSQPTLGVVVNLPHLNPSSIALYSRLLSGRRRGDPLVRVQWLVVDGSLDQIGECQYVLARTGLESADWVAPIEREFEEMVRRHPERFQKAVSFPIPLKNAEAVIYRVLPEQRTSTTIEIEAASAPEPPVTCRQ